MSLITLHSKGDFKNTDRFLQKVARTISKDAYVRWILEKYAEVGVKRLQELTPKRTGLTANSWTYKVSANHGKGSIEWINTNINNGVPIAIILQYGHGTRNGGYVAGVDYINPAVQKAMEDLIAEVWKEVTNV